MLELLFAGTLLISQGPNRFDKANEYGPAEHGHALSADLLRDGYISLFDGKTTFGWSDAQVKDGLLRAGRSNLSFEKGQFSLDAAKPGTFDFGSHAVAADQGRIEHKLKGAGQVQWKDGLQIRSILFRPSDMVDISPKKIGGDWKAILHPKIAKERQTTWTIKDGTLHAINGPGGLEYQGKQYANFIMQLEVRTRVRYANGGVFFRAIPGDFMNGYEAQVYNRCQDGDLSKPWKWATGAIDDRQNARRLISRDGEWFHYTIIAVGDRLATWVNGHQTVEWRDERKPHDNPRHGKRTSAGVIQLQAHDYGTDLEFRNLRIAEWK